MRRFVCAVIASFSYEGSIQFQEGYDYVEIDGQRFDGENEISGAAAGAAVVQMWTNGTVQSRGIDFLKATCTPDAVQCSGRRCATASSPLPHNFGYAVQWDPCRGGPYRFTGNVQFEQGYDYVEIDGRRFDGDGAISGEVVGPTQVRVHTDYSIASGGISLLEAEGIAAVLVCNGVSCETEPKLLPHNFDYTVNWDPCAGGAFNFVGSIEFEEDYDFMRRNRLKDHVVAPSRRWHRSGQRAEEFAASVGVRAGTLQWWSWRLARDTRAPHGSPEVTAIEIALPAESRSKTVVEVAVGDAVVRCEVGTDAEYVASLVRAIGKG